MRLQGILVVAALLAACSKPEAPAQAPAAAPSPSQTIFHNLPAARWIVRDGTVTGESVALQKGGTLFAQNARTPAAEGDVYRGEITVQAAAPGDVTLRISNGCGTDDLDMTTVGYHLTAGANTLKAAHAFTRPATCARLTLAATDAVTVTLGENALRKR